MRKWLQVIILLLFFIVPYFDLFRIDIPGGHYYWFTRRLPFSQAMPLLLTVLWLVFLVLGLSFFKPRLFCSHLCPHNTMSKFLRALQRYKLDLPLAILLTPLVAFTLIAYFVDPRQVWSAITQGTSGMILIFFLFLCLFIGALLLRLRHKFCSNVCPYGHLQHLIRPERTTTLGKIVTAALLLLLGSATVLSVFFTSGLEINLGTIARVNAGHKMIYTYELRLVNNRKQPETVSVTFHKLQPIRSPFAEPILVQPGEAMQIPFSFEVQQTEEVEFDVCPQEQADCKQFHFSLSGT
ncbi:4Fe-4S binding protein [Tumebacillus sp. BK434]|uniref:4Fe-4S binding protein n=1 Tax=Tumebacillus sp. BK434 TaxID=2512169 RepID=UPI00104821D3|nr:4Fe-4S binding protein [Tumebacillus sp. BK434]TCP58314.1 4Fe-4S binding protein [Tumebacillus sp. BK434]